MLTVYTVADLCHPLSPQWNASLILTSLTQPWLKEFCRSPFVHSQEPDLLRWKPATSGDCTTKEAFEILNQQVTTPIPSHGARRITSHTRDLFKRIWRHKTIPPRIKTFSRRLLRQALATGSMPGRFTKHINQNCQLCGKMDFTRAFFGLVQIPASFGPAPE